MRLNITDILTKDEIKKRLENHYKKDNLFTFVFIMQILVSCSGFLVLENTKLASGVLYQILGVASGFGLIFHMVFFNKSYSKMKEHSKLYYELKNNINDYQRINLYRSLKSIDNYCNKVAKEKRDLTLYEFNELEKYFYYVKKEEEKNKFFSKVH